MRMWMDEDRSDLFCMGVVNKTVVGSIFLSQRGSFCVLLGVNLNLKIIEPVSHLLLNIVNKHVKDRKFFSSSSRIHN